MATSRITITQEDRYQTIVYPYYTDKDVKGSVVVLHGMAEHHARYERFAAFLNSNGYDVYLYDHRGHGTDKKLEELGHFSDTNGVKLVVRDAITVLRYVKENNRGSKFVLFSHSMGSIIARNVLAQYDEMDAAIISGTAYSAPIVSFMGLGIINTVKLFKGPRYRSTMLSNQITGYKEFSKISDRTSVDWLTRDQGIVGAYISDPYCGFVCTTAFYHDLVKLTFLAALRRNIKKTRRDLPIFVISGSHDPVGGYSDGINKYFSILNSCGFTKADCNIYEECRHELLNELNSDVIMNDILNWIEAVEK